MFVLRDKGRSNFFWLLRAIRSYVVAFTFWCMFSQAFLGNKALKSDIFSLNCAHISGHSFIFKIEFLYFLIKFLSRSIKNICLLNLKLELLLHVFKLWLPLLYLLPIFLSFIFQTHLKLRQLHHQISTLGIIKLFIHHFDLYSLLSHHFLSNKREIIIWYIFFSIN